MHSWELLDSVSASEPLDASAGNAKATRAMANQGCCCGNSQTMGAQGCLSPQPELTAAAAGAAEGERGTMASLLPASKHTSVSPTVWI